ncbi:LuxR family transcriptional regulator [Mycolicibacterium celeriflavum]|uniref:LuxR family transcriptional regulator n=1 Tax=Mycolicibacterium celeriflavum TaxID=1249101 RepID=UPI003CF187AB
MKSIPLQVLADEQLGRARRYGGHAAYTVHGGPDRGLRQTVVALIRGLRLRQEADPAEATLQVLRGHVRLSTIDDRWDGVVGDQLTLPPRRHYLDALQDSAILLTVHADEPHTPGVALDRSMRSA